MKMKYNKEDCYKNLENINSWINNSDTKASIMLGIIGVIITIVLTNNELITKYMEILDKVIKDNSFGNMIYIFCVISSFITIIVGIFRLFKVINPTLKKQANSIKVSHLYFMSIASFNDSESFQNSLKETSEKDIIDDILNQIYINAVICTDKFNCFKKGLQYSLTGFGMIIILFFIGIIMYL